MGEAKSLIVRPISSRDARATIERLHYSGKVDPRSQLHMGVFWRGSLEGALQFGPSIDKRKTIGLVRGTGWNEFIELNRMAFSEALPRNSESRAISVAMRLLKRHAPHIKWVLSYADGTQCGDGTIYRASGFILTQIKKNKSMWRMPDGNVVCDIVFQPSFSSGGANSLKARYGKTGSESAHTFFKSVGAKPVPGFQMRYIRFIDPEWRGRLAVQEVPFSQIKDLNAGMYRGEKRQQ